MGPFSHGIIPGLNIGLCLLLLSVKGIGISCGFASVHNEMPRPRPAQQSPPLPPPPPQRSGKTGSPAEPTSAPDTRRLKPNEVKRQMGLASQHAGVAVLPLGHHGPCRRRGVHKHSLLFTVSWNHHRSSARPGDSRKRLNVAEEVRVKTHPRGRQTQSNLGRSEFGDIFRKLKTLHLMTCRTCSLKFGHIGTRTPGQYQAHAALPSDSIGSIHLRHHRNRRSPRGDGLMPNHLSKAERGYFRKKKSAKKNERVVITSKSERRTTKGQRRPTVEQEGQHRTAARAKETNDGGSATLQTTTSPVKRTDHGISVAASRTGQASFRQNQASAAGRKTLDEDDQSLGEESSEGQQTGTVTVTAPSQSAQGVSGSDKEPSPVEDDTHGLGLEGRRVNWTELLVVLKDRELQRKLRRDAQVAYLCLVAVVCLMMWALWCLGGLDTCRYRPDDVVRFTDLQPLVTAKDVLRGRRKYLPMFNDPEWEEVLMCNRGSDP